MSTATGCSFFADPDKDQQLDDLFRTGTLAMQEKRFRDAQEKFEKIEKEHPFSIYQQYLYLALGYIHYQNQQYPEADAKLDRYIRSNPNGRYLAYAYYLKGLTLYNTSVGTINLILRRDRTSKDPQFMIGAFETFKTLITRFPQSRYTPVAKQYIFLLRNILAVYEVRVADFYMRRGAYVAVVNRAKYVLEHYPGAQHTPQALFLLAQGYQELGLNDLARDTLRVLDLNHPNYASGAIGAISTKDQKTWLETMRGLSGTILEQIKLKPRY